CGDRGFPGRPGRAWPPILLDGSQVEGRTMAVEVVDARQQDEAQDGLDDVSRRGLALYETRLKARLQPERNGEARAIPVDTGEHALARSGGNAVRALRKLRPQGALVLMRVGLEPQH